MSALQGSPGRGAGKGGAEAPDRGTLVCSRKFLSQHSVEPQRKNGGPGAFCLLDSFCRFF